MNQNESNSNAKPRVFISYGRVDADLIARRLETELLAKGYDVWLDQSKIRGGREWEREIIDGLQATQVVIALLSPHSTRHVGSSKRMEDGKVDAGDSVCLDELAYARFHPPEKPIVPALVVPGAEIPLTVYRLHTIDLVNAQTSEQVFREKLAEIDTAIQEAIAGRLRFRQWGEWLRPQFDFTRFLYERRRNFTGRQWLIDAIDAWRTTGRKKAALLTGGPGSGKSALVAELSFGNFYRNTLATYCCQWDLHESLKAENFVQELVAQTASRLPAYAVWLSSPDCAANRKLKEEGDLNSYVEMMFLQPLEQLPSPENGPRVIVLDGLDESLARDGSILRLVKFLKNRLPSWVRLLITTRPEAAILESLGDLDPFTIHLDSEANRNDLSEYVDVRFAQADFQEHFSHHAASRDKLKDQILQRADGNILIAVQILDGLESGLLKPDQVAYIPPGLPGIYETFLDRHVEQGWEFENVRSVFEVLCVAREPLPLGLLAEVVGMTSTSLTAMLRPIRSLLNWGPPPDRFVSLWHKSFADWLVDIDRAGSATWIDRSRGNNLLSDYLSTLIDDQIGRATMADFRHFAIKHVLWHLFEERRFEDIASAVNQNPTAVDGFIDCHYGWYNSWHICTDPDIEVKKAWPWMSPIELLITGNVYAQRSIRLFQWADNYRVSMDDESTKDTDVFEKYTNSCYTSLGCAAIAIGCVMVAISSKQVGWNSQSMFKHETLSWLCTVVSHFRDPKWEQSMKLCDMAYDLDCEARKFWESYRNDEG